MLANKTRTTRPNQVTGKAARRGIWIQKPEPPPYDLAKLRIRQAETVKKTYTSVVNVPVLKYVTATPEELQEKKDRIADEKKVSSKNMEKRIKRFCHAYRLPNPEHNSHSTIPKEAPWLASRPDATEHSHVIHAAIPEVKVEDLDQNENNTIPLHLTQCHYFYSDTGIASWRVAKTKDGEIARLQASTNNTSFREYAWRLSYLVCQGKREMRLMARDKNEKCGPLSLFSQHSLVKELKFEMPVEKDAYKHEGVPISRAVRMMFQTADMEAFAKLSAIKTGLPCGTPKRPKKNLSADDIQIVVDGSGDESDGDNELKQESESESEQEIQLEPEPESEPEPDPEEKQTDGDDRSNNGQEESSKIVGDQEPEVEQQTVIPETRTTSPTGKAKKVNCNSGCCAFL